MKKVIDLSLSLGRLKFIRKIASLGFVLAFLFALSGKTIHVLAEHHEEELCTEKSVHIHNKEHSCFICEFNIQVSDTHFFYAPVLAVCIAEGPAKIVSPVHVSTLSQFNFSLRGPPVA